MKLRTQILINLAFTLISFTVKGQTLRVKGQVTDGTSGDGLPFVSITCNGCPNTLTDEAGYFSLQPPATQTALRFFYVGYDTLVHVLTEKSFHNQVCQLKIKLYPSVAQLKQVVVSSGKFEQNRNEVSVSTELLKPRLVEQTNSVRLDETLDLLPGVNLVNKQINIRGGNGFSYGAGSRVAVLMDGLPLLSADAADVKWDALPLENLEQVEIIKGASSALFGSGALGGVVHLRTAVPKTTAQTKVRIFSGVYDDPANTSFKYWSKSPMQSGGSVWYAKKFGAYELSTGIFYLKDDGYRQGENTETFRMNANNTWRNRKVKGLSYGLNANAVFTSGGNFLFWKDAQHPYVPASGTLSIVQNNKYNADPFIQYTTAGNSKHSLRNRCFLTDNVNNTQQGSTAYLWYSEYQYQKFVRFADQVTATFTTGISYTFNKVRSDSLYGMHSGHNNALYAQLDQKVGRVNISFGARMERNKVDTIKTEYYPVFRGGVNVQTGKATFLRASLGQGYRFASVAERFASTTAGQLKIFPNPQVKPETGWSAEIGLRQGFKLNKWIGYADVALFWTEYYNMIDFTFGFYPPPVYDPLNNYKYFGFSAVNYTNARINGFELSSGTEGDIMGLPLRLLAGYTFIDPVNKDYVKQPYDTLGHEDKLKYRFQHSLKLNADLTIKKVDIGFSWRYNSYMLNIDPALGLFINGVSAYRLAHQTGYGIVDTRISYNLYKAHRIALVIKNVMNKEYMFFPGNMGAPRTFNVQYNVSF